MKPMYRKRDSYALEKAYTPEHGAVAEISGEVESLRVHNTGSGWGFGKLWTTDKVEVSFTGNVASVYEGAQVTIRGKWQNNERFGWQVAASVIVVDFPDSKNGVCIWLETHFPDIGPERAKRIVAAFPPPGLWDILDKEPQRLEEVEGIGPVIAQQVGQTYVWAKAERDVYIDLIDYGLKVDQVRDAVRRWGRKTIEVLKDDPYRLVEIGISFKQADNLGMRNGIKRGDPRRIVAGHVCAMQQVESDGHTVIGLKSLQSIAASADVLSISLRDVIAQWPVVRERGVLVEVLPGQVSFAVRAAQEERIALFLRSGEAIKSLEAEYSDEIEQALKPQTEADVGLGYDDMRADEQELYDIVHADIGDK